MDQQDLPARLYEEIVAATPDGVLYSDHEGRIRFWNHGATRIFGFSAAEALGASLDLIIPATLRERHWQGYERVMASGVSGYGERLLAVPALHRDGHTLSVEFSIALHHTATGRPCGVSAIVRDVSDRFQRERQLRAELEHCRRAAIVPPRD